jgi:cytoskeletal protein CcmA (bactofilin family)
MFKRGKVKDTKPQMTESKQSKEQAATAPQKFETCIGETTNISGDIQFTGVLRIYGSVTGDLTANGADAVLILENQGSIKGEVHVSNLFINGNIEGNVYVAETIELFQGACVHGDVHYNLLDMAVGAEVNGRLLKENMVPPSLPEPEPLVIEAEEVTEDGSK